MIPIRVVDGDPFKGGRLVVKEGKFALRTGALTFETIPLASIREITEISREKRATAENRLLTGAAGGILGGIAAGALAGGLTGPAGAAIGAVAGAILAGRKKFRTCRVELRDGRFFFATGLESAWVVFKDQVQRHAQAELTRQPADVPIKVRTNLLPNLRNRLFKPKPPS